MTSPGLPGDAYLRRRRPTLLAAIVAAHLLAFYCWPARTPTAGVIASAVDIVFIAAPRQAPSLPPAPVQALPPAPVQATHVPARRPARPHAPAMVLIAPPSTVPQPVPSPPVARPEAQADAAALPQADPSAASIRAGALAAAGAIDRDLRKASLALNQRTPTLRSALLERGIAAALVQRGPPKVEESVMADGRRISRIGNKCAYMESNALTRGRDVMQQGVRTVWASCDYAR